MTERSARQRSRKRRENFLVVREVAIPKAGAEIRNWTVYGNAIHDNDHEAIFV